MATSANSVDLMLGNGSLKATQGTRCVARNRKPILSNKRNRKMVQNNVRNK